MARAAPPFRAQHVESLLRSAELHETRARARPAVSVEQLHALEDRLIHAAMARPESIGLRAVSDGEFRRDGDFMKWDSDRAGGFEPLRLLPSG